MATRYLILRTTTETNLGTRGFDSLSLDGLESVADGATLETVDGRETDAGTLREDPKNAAVIDADIMLSLVQPAASGAADLASLRATGALQMPAGLLAVGAHTTPFTGQGVSVAVLDTGIAAHEAFKNKSLVTRNFTGVGLEADVTDTNGHGTHCAGTICGQSVNGVQVGVAPGVTKLCIGKVLGPNGGTVEMLLKGMLWAVFDQKAAVVSMSLGYDLAGNTQRLVTRGLSVTQAANVVLRQQADLIDSIEKLRAFLQAQSPNVVFVAASGNESDRTKNFVLDASLPAAKLLAVGAVGATAAGDKWEVARFSNSRVEVVAPGVDVVSASHTGGWATMSGTSMATPHVAGVAALLVQKARSDGSINVPDTVRATLKASATRAPLWGNDASALGSGMVQAPQS